MENVPAIITVVLMIMLPGFVASFLVFRYLGVTLGLGYLFSFLAVILVIFVLHALLGRGFCATAAGLTVVASFLTIELGQMLGTRLRSRKIQKSAKKGRAD